MVSARRGLCGAGVVQPWLWCGGTVKEECGGPEGGPEDDLVAAVCVKLEDGAAQGGGHREHPGGGRLVFLQSCVSGWDSEPVHH